ncbi:putative UDP-glucose dehydrogenase Ugd1 [Aspergillus clavatus NRRL 1]|uniref:UDP-glucose 6-dehydrogenase n=1 Tax=Aspergillus clavatus (strain ATCC 1007 / CBS 513.65 / DSM 816 / NCTC 3887 / NRRL 1 / QM 1276 / 107) TaxID=344612 RepID=A1C8W5_ASPCL|nr:UDP-glucose dehydrogenase Ugd1, putative [Aspergillus clavatus NRRL 1]EAW13752.1 UDP-glucose dehydrogenase Ugd1, putative [Aspergillus clavatus NRRL 1]
MPFLPFLVFLAGLTLLISRRRRKTIQDRESPKVIVSGRTYSESVGDDPLSVRDEKIENVRNACIVGAGHVGALTGIILASQNPHVQFHIVDGESRLIAAWNSDRLPVLEPGLDDLVFDNKRPDASTEPSRRNDSPAETNGSPEVQQRRVRKLRNITFSTDIHAGIVASDLIFLCLDPPLDGTSDDAPGLDLSNLQAAVRTIAQVSTGHKIIVHRGTGPYGIVQRIKKILRKTASPSASFDVLSNPEFLVPGTAVQNLLYPRRLIIGHIFSEDMSPAALTALKRLYAWVPDDRIITMDAWSSELGKIAAAAVLAQKMSNMQSMSVICESTNANITHVARIVGSNPLTRLETSGSSIQRDVGCLVYLARELGLPEVAEYWTAVLKMNNYQIRRIAQSILDKLPVETEQRDVAVLGFASKWNTIEVRNTTAVHLIRHLTRNGVKVTIYDPHVPKDQIERALGLVSGHLDAVTVVENLDSACAGCSALVLHTAWEQFAEDRVDWKVAAKQMEPPKVVFDLPGMFDQERMEKLGLQVVRLDVDVRPKGADA